MSSWEKSDKKKLPPVSISIPEDFRCHTAAVSSPNSRRTLRNPKLKKHPFFENSDCGQAENVRVKIRRPPYTANGQLLSPRKSRSNNNDNLLQESIIPPEFHLIRNNAVQPINQFSPDKYFTKFNGSSWDTTIFPSLNAHTRQEVHHLQKTLKRMLVQASSEVADTIQKDGLLMEGERMMEFTKREVKIYSIVFHEINRQLQAISKKHASLLTDIRGRYDITMNRLLQHIKKLESSYEEDRKEIQQLKDKNRQLESHYEAMLQDAINIGLSGHEETPQIDVDEIVDHEDLSDTSSTNSLKLYIENKENGAASIIQKSFRRYKRRKVRKCTEILDLENAAARVLQNNIRFHHNRAIVKAQRAANIIIEEKRIMDLSISILQRSIKLFLAKKKKEREFLLHRKSIVQGEQSLDTEQEIDQEKHDILFQTTTNWILKDTRSLSIDSSGDTLKELVESNNKRKLSQHDQLLSKISYYLNKNTYQNEDKQNINETSNFDCKENSIFMEVEKQLDKEFNENQLLQLTLEDRESYIMEQNEKISYLRKKLYLHLETEKCKKDQQNKIFNDILGLSDIEQETKEDENHDTGLPSFDVNKANMENKVQKWPRASKLISYILSDAKISSRKAKSITWLKQVIYSIYDTVENILFDDEYMTRSTMLNLYLILSTAEFKEATSTENINKKLPNTCDMIFYHFQCVFGLRDLVDQAIADLIVATTAHSDHDVEIGFFATIVDGTRSDEAILFFFNCRRLLKKSSSSNISLAGKIEYDIVENIAKELFRLNEESCIIEADQVFYTEINPSSTPSRSFQQFCALLKLNRKPLPKKQPTASNKRSLKNSINNSTSQSSNKVKPSHKVNYPTSVHISDVVDLLLKFYCDHHLRQREFGYITRMFATSAKTSPSSLTLDEFVGAIQMCQSQPGVPSLRELRYMYQNVLYQEELNEMPFRLFSNSVSQLIRQDMLYFNTIDTPGQTGATNDMLRKNSAFVAISQSNRLLKEVAMSYSRKQRFLDLYIDKLYYSNDARQIHVAVQLLQQRLKLHQNLTRQFNRKSNNGKRANFLESQMDTKELMFTYQKLLYYSLFTYFSMRDEIKQQPLTLANLMTLEEMWNDLLDEEKEEVT